MLVLGLGIRLWLGGICQVSYLMLQVCLEQGYLVQGFRRNIVPTMLFTTRLFGAILFGAMLLCRVVCSNVVQHGVFGAMLFGTMLFSSGLFSAMLCYGCNICTNNQQRWSLFALMQFGLGFGFG